MVKIGNQDSVDVDWNIQDGGCLFVARITFPWL